MTFNQEFARLRIAARQLWVEILRGLCPPGYKVIRAFRSEAMRSEPEAMEQARREREAREASVRG